MKETIEIEWFKTEEQLPRAGMFQCYGAYYHIHRNGLYCQTFDNIRFNRRKNRWERRTEVTSDYCHWEECAAPEYWAYMQLPRGPEILKGD